MSANEQDGQRGSLFSGIVLILIGGLFLLDTFVAQFGSLVRDYWPMLLVALGVAKAIDGRRPGNAIWMIALGIWLQVSHLGLFGLDWSSSWPILLILIGGGMALQAIVDAATRRGNGKGDHHAPQA